MMNTTHVAIAASLVAPLAVVLPEFATIAGLAAILGAAAPDLDIVLGEHRRTLHYPILGWIPTVPAVLLMVAVPGEVTVGVACFLLGFATHSTMDVVGGGPERRPWTTRSRRGVYAHVPVPGRWLVPRRWVRYDGAPEDFLFGLAAAIPALVVFTGPVRSLLVAGITISLFYTLFRKQIPDVTDRLFG